MRVAPLRLRLLAGLIDAAVIIAGMAALVGMGIAGVVAYTHIRGRENEQEGEEDDEHEDDEEGEPFESPMAREFRLSPNLRAVLSGASAGLAVASRNWRGPGFRVVGLRRVDARTRGIVSVRSAVIGVLFDQAWQAGSRRLFGSRARRQRDRTSALRPQLTTVMREHAGDPQARQRAVMECYKSNDVNPLAGCGWLLAGPVVSQLLLALGTRGGRTVRDRITGTGVVVDH